MTPFSLSPDPSSPYPKWLSGLLRFAPSLLALLLYAPILRLPNMYDTLLHTQLADDLTLWTVWLPNSDFGFYRPLVFLPLVLLQNAIGTPAFLLQLLNLGQHTLNVWLLTVLVERLSGRRDLAVIAGLLLAAFPFGYQALAIYGNNGYLTVTTFILWGLLLGLTGRPTPRRRWGLAAVQLAGFLVHETAVLLAPLVLLWLFQTGDWRLETGEGRFKEGSGRGRMSADNRSLVSRLQSFLPLIIAWGAYLIVYLFLPRGGGPQLDYGGNALWPKLLLFMQTLSHPLAWFAHLLPDLSAQLVILTSLGLTMGVGGWAWWRQPGLRPLLLFGLGWWLMGSLLVGFTLPTYYIADGARLLYPGAAGLALAWGVMLLPSAERDWRSFQRWVLLTGVAFVLLSGGRFIRQMIGYYAMVGEPVDALNEQFDFQFSEPATAADLVWVNLPQWVSPPRNTYAIGTEFAPLLGDHLFAAELVRANQQLSTTQVESVTTLVVPELRQATPYNVGLYTLGAVDQLPIPDLRPQLVFVSRYGDEGITTVKAGELWRPGAVAEPPLGRVGPYELVRLSAACRGDEAAVELSLVLRPVEPVPSTLSLFVQALDEQGLIAQADGPPLGIPPERIAGGMVWDQRRIELPDDGRRPQTVLLGAYDFMSGERFAAATADGERLADEAWVVVVEGCGDSFD